MVTESAPKSAVKEASLPQTSSYAHYCGGGCTERTLDDKAGMCMPHRVGRKYINSQISYVYVLASPRQLLRKTESSQSNTNDSEAKEQVSSLHSLMNSKEVTRRF